MEVYEDECAVTHLCLDFWEMKHNFKKCVLAIEKNCKQKLIKNLYTPEYVTDV